MFTVLLFTIFQHNNRIKIKNYFSMIQIYTAIHSFCIILITLTVNICMKINNASVGNDLIVSTCSPYMELSLHNHYTPLGFFPEVTWYCNTSMTTGLRYNYIKKSGTAYHSNTVLDKQNLKQDLRLWQNVTSIFFLHQNKFKTMVSSDYADCVVFAQKPGNLVDFKEPWRSGQQ